MRDNERRVRALERRIAARRRSGGARDPAAIIAEMRAELEIVASGGELPARSPITTTPGREAMIEELMAEVARHARLLGTDAPDPEA